MFTRAIAFSVFVVVVLPACSSSDSNPESPADDAASDSAVVDTAPEVSSGTATLGAPCASDAECVTGLVCLEATGKDMLGASGPAGGYCSKDCLSYVKGDVDLDPCLAIGGRCYGKKSDASAWCLEACAFGAAEAGVKCHGREDVGCTAAIDRTGAKTTNAYCEPICGAKSDCGGRVCDEGTSRCVDKGGEHPGDPDGTASAGSTATTCAGFNVPVAVAADGGTTTVYVCGARCVWGDAAQSCGANGACLYSPSSRGPGDARFCGELCDKDDDCHDKVHVVRCDKSLAAKLGGRGFCSIVGISPTTDGGVGDGGADVGGDAATDGSDAG